MIDEIWMFGDHFFSLLGEAWMAGPQSFFINGPSFPDFAVDRAIAGYGFNYERGVAEMIHNHGHRTENHISRLYGGWNLANPTTPWDYFGANAAQTNRTTYGVGSVRYPFNGASDYDYANAQTLNSYADDIVANFPHPTYAAVPLTRDAWGDEGVGDWQRGFLKWFFGHMPRDSGTGTDGRANNWYKYLNDFNAYRPNTGLARDNEAILGAPPLQTAGTFYEFTLRYYDVQGINPGTLGAGDVLVTGPGDYSQLVEAVAIGAPVATTAGWARTVRYRVAGPGGAWDSADSASYSVTLRSNEVLDAAGAPLPSADLGTFSVNITDQTRLDMPALLSAGQATVAATTWDIGGPGAMFDTSSSSLYRSTNINPAVVTLSFSQPQSLIGFRLLLSHPGDWKIESANSLADLNGQTGTYSLTVPTMGAPSNAFSTKMLASTATATHFRLTVQRTTGDNYVHINSWELLRPTIADAVAPIAMLQGSVQPIAGEATTLFNVRYADDVSIRTASTNFGDVRITGPNGFVQTAAFYGVDSNANGIERMGSYFVQAPGGSWNYADNGVYAIELAANQVFDLSGKAASPTVLGEFTVNFPSPESRPRIDLTELNAADWFAHADAAATATSNDSARKTLGASSVRFTTNDGFDAYLRYEPLYGSAWNLTDAIQFHFDVYAENSTQFGFQAEPIVRFIDADGDAVEFRYFQDGSPFALWNSARNAWISQTISIKSTAQPATGWRGTAIGTPDWTRMHTVEIHADTWDFGFSLSFDRMGFNLPIVVGDFNYDLRVDGADFLMWQRNPGGLNPSVDHDGSGQVGSGDLDLWKANYGSPAIAATAQPVTSHVGVTMRKAAAA